MTILVTVKPRAKKVAVESPDGVHFTVWVTAPPEGGKANEAVLKTLAEHFGVAVSRCSIRMGRTTRDKVIEIAD